MLADLHNHALPCSRDSTLTVVALAAEAAAAGVDAVALTDHEEGGDFALATRIVQDHGLVFLPGREIVCTLGHVLVFSSDTEWLSGLPERSELHFPGGAPADVALVWAHPAGWRVAGATINPDPTLPEARLVHGVEVLNGARLWQTGGVEAAERVAETLGAGRTGGSDSHAAGAVGRCLTRIDGVPAAGSANDAIAAIRAGSIRAELGAEWARIHRHSYEREDLARYVTGGTGGTGGGYSRGSSIA